jgi:radical SAM additional 4Fe4S-binding domain
MKRFLLRNCNESAYFLCFDRDEGKFIRQGYNETEPFYNLQGPELLDISITNYCDKGCSFCYRKSNSNGDFITIEDYEFIMQQAEKIGVLQVALGGGNPNQHPNFVNILEITRKYGIIPSYTTNGYGMTDDIYFATQKYCGAVAVSWYKPYFQAEKVIEKCNENGIKINIHFLLNRDTVDEAIDLLTKRKDILNRINAIIFLNYKPIHTSKEQILSESTNLHSFLQTALKVRECKIGFDSCMISYLAKFKNSLNIETVDYCEAARFSAYISENLLLYPCSFFNDTNIQGINLKNTSLQNGWQNGDEFVRLRRKLLTPSEQEYPIYKCRSCDSYQFCHGGCQIFNINYCRTGDDENIER